MDARSGLRALKPIAPAHFALLRVALGAWLAFHFLSLLPWAAEVYGRTGVLPEAGLNFTAGILPSPLEHWDDPRTVTAFVGALAGLSAAFAAGILRRPAALLLWYGIACLFNRNNLSADPAIAYLGLLLLLTCTVPPGEGSSLGGWRPRAEWFFPAWAFRAAWWCMALGYTASGVDKLLNSPSWVDGSAVALVLDLPVARPGPVRDLLQALPESGLRALTWAFVGLEASFVALCLHPTSRMLAWGTMAVAHVGIGATVAFGDLTAGMLLLHAFTFDPAWLPGGRARVAGSDGAPPPQPGAR